MVDVVTMAADDSGAALPMPLLPVMPEQPAVAAEARPAPAQVVTPARAPSLQWPLVLGLAILMLGVVISAVWDFRAGAMVMAGGLAVATALRAVLPKRAGGWLVNRSRLIDLVIMGGMCAAMVALALTVRPPV